MSMRHGLLRGYRRVRLLSGINMEFILWVADKNPGQTPGVRGFEDYRNGQVITCKPDGWAWSKLELNHPNWRIVRADVHNTHAQAMLAHQSGDHQKEWLKLRKYHIDITNAAISSALANTPSNQVTSIAAADFIAATVLDAP